MTTSVKRYVTLNLVSPIGLVALSYCFFLVAWIFPPGVYSEHIGEPDYMFFQPTTMFFVTLCTASFVVGAFLTGRKANREGAVEAKPLSASAPTRLLCVPIVVFTVYCLLYLRVLNGSLNVFGLLASSQGQALKDVVQVGGLSQGIWDYGINLLIATLWWASIRVTQFEITGTRKTIFNVVFWLGVAVGMLTCLARADRTILTAFIAGLGICLIYRKVRIQGSSLWQVFLIAASIVGVILGFFVLLSFLRGFGSGQLLIFVLLGYSIVSYNRLSALLLGVMHYTYQGSGVYLVRYISAMYYNSFFSFIPQALGFPDATSVWRSEFLSVGAAGLFLGFNWSTTFGYVFSDIGWFSPIFFFLTGLLCGRAWTWFVGKRLLGLIVYPWFGFWIVFWIGWNCIFDYELVGLLEGCVLLAVYERFFFSSSPAAERPSLETAGLLKPVQQGRPIA